MDYDKKIKDLDISIPKIHEPVASYLPYRITGNLLYISGQDCRVDGTLKYKGKVGKEVSEEEGYDAARIACINSLAVIKYALGTLNKLEKIVNLHGYVNSADGFVRQPYVINGASDLLGEIFGENGKHSRCALSSNELPFNTPVELEMIVELKSE